MEKAKGAYLWDIEGRKFVDFTAGIAVTALGHSNEEIANILYDQALTVIHTSNLYHNLWTGELSKSLIETTLKSGGMSKAAKVFLSNSGTEANEAAIKFARKWGYAHQNEEEPGSKFELITFQNGFHGRSCGSLSVTPNPKYQKPFAPLLPGVHVAQLNDLSSVEKVISDKTCGIIVEPIQGEGGVNIATEEFLVGLKQLATKHNALLIFDEIQCGLGRTGRLWAHGSLPPEAHPDILTMAKALGNGFPIGATMITEDVESVLKVGDHGTTYGGNPLGSRIGHYVLSQVSSKTLLDGVQEKSKIFTDKFSNLTEKYPDIVNGFRGEGLLLGLQINPDSPITPNSIIDKARQHGLLIISAGNNTIRFVPALNIENKVIEEGLDIFEKSMEELVKGSAFFKKNT